MRVLATSADGSVDFLVDDDAPIGEEFTQPEAIEADQPEEVLQDAEESSLPEEEDLQDVEQAEQSSEDSETLQDEEQLAPQADAAAPRFSGNKYYTPIYGSEGFYTPWGKSSLDAGTEYFKIGIGAISLVGLLIFAIPFGIALLREFVAKFQDSLK